MDTDDFLDSVTGLIAIGVIGVVASKVVDTLKIDKTKGGVTKW